MKTTKNDSTADILKEFDRKFISGVRMPVDGRLAELERAKQFLAQALNRKDEEWKEKVQGLKMEKLRHGYFDTTEYCEGDCHDCSYNQAVDKFNQKIDELPK